MSCFTKTSIDLLSGSVIDALNAAADKQTKLFEQLKDNIKQYKTDSINPLLPTGLKAKIASQWLAQPGDNAPLLDLYELLAYYQVPYPGAWPLNLLCSGFLLFCDEAAKNLDATRLGNTLKSKQAHTRFVFELAKSLQAILLHANGKNTAMCLRPQYFKTSEQPDADDQAGLMFKQTYQTYLPLLASAMTEVGLWQESGDDIAIEAAGDADAVAKLKDQKQLTRSFAFCTEGGLTEAQSRQMLKAIVIADDMLNLTQQWHIFTTKGTRLSTGSLISRDPAVQRKVATVFADIFKQTTQGSSVIEFKDKSIDFFEGQFGLSILETIHNQYRSGDPVQLRAFSPDASYHSFGGSTVIDSDSSTGKAVGRSVDRECQLTPLTTGTIFSEKDKIELGDPGSPVKKPPESARERRQLKYRAYQQKLALSGMRSVRDANDFFAQISRKKTHLKRMVIRVNVDICLSEASQSGPIHTDIQFANQYAVADTIIHELLHTWYAMVDFYYADQRKSLLIDTKWGYSFNSLKLGTKEKQSDINANIKNANQGIYPRGVKFSTDDYSWQINNNDNYMIAMHKIYFLDDVLYKQTDVDYGRNRKAEKLALARTRFAALTAIKADLNSILSSAFSHRDHEQAFWAHLSHEFEGIIGDMTPDSDYVKHFRNSPS